EEVKQPAPRDVEEFVAELHRKYGFDNDEDHCFLSVECVPDARGTVVATSWQSVSFATTELLRMTRDFGFALYDPQRLRLYDPRDHIDIDISAHDLSQRPIRNGCRVEDAFATSAYKPSDRQWEVPA